MARVQKPADEARSARINLAFVPELKRQLEDCAAVDEISVNALIERICLDYVKTRADDLNALEAFRARIRQKNSADAEPTAG